MRPVASRCIALLVSFGELHLTTRVQISDKNSRSILPAIELSLRDELELRGPGECCREEKFVRHL